MKTQDLINPAEIWKESILAKMDGLVSERKYQNLDKCGREEIYVTCEGCGHFDRFYYACNLKFCPMCNWKISRRRTDILKCWTKRITQPKHLVLTQRNFETLTRTKIRRHGLAIAKLRRHKLWKGVRGGCRSTEITNDGSNGWHLHSHFLLDVDWLAMDRVSVEWGKLVNQEYGIVKIKDARSIRYLGELTKYVCKPSELAGWQPEMIAQFIHAIEGQRFFATFGTLFHEGASVRAELFSKRQPRICECGCEDWKWTSETSEMMKETRNL